MFSTVPRSDITEKVYTRNDLVLLDTSIIQFQKKFYIPAIQKLSFHLPHVRILGNHHSGKDIREAFKIRVNLHDILCRRDYVYRVVSSFEHQIQSIYYGGNRSISIEGVELDHFGAFQHPSPLLKSVDVYRQAAFHYFLSDYRK